MQAWILDESPGSLPVRHDRRPAGRRRTTWRCGPVASALNHMDLWLTRGRPAPAAAPRARAATWPASSRRSGDGVDGWAVGDEVVVNPAVAPARGDRRARRRRAARPGLPDPRRAAVGRPRRAGRRARPQPACARPAGRSWEECAAYPLATLTAWRMLRRARLTAGERCLIVGIGGGVSTAALAPRRAHGRRGPRHVPRRRPSASAALDARCRRAPTTPARTGRSRPTSWSRASARPPGTARSGPSPAAAGSSCAAARPGQKVELDLPRLFFKQIEVIGSTMGGVRRVRRGHPPGRAGPAGVGRQHASTSSRTPRRSAPARGRRPAGQGRPAPTGRVAGRGPGTPLKERLRAEVEARADLLVELSHEIHAHPEPNYEEHFAHDLLTGVLEDEGLAVERSALRRRHRLRGAGRRRRAHHRRAVRVRRPARHRPRLRPQHHRHRRARRRPGRRRAGRRGRRAGGRAGHAGRGGRRRQDPHGPARAPSTASTPR